MYIIHIIYVKSQWKLHRPRFFKTPNISRKGMCQNLALFKYSRGQKKIREVELLFIHVFLVFFYFYLILKKTREIQFHEFFWLRL